MCHAAKTSLLAFKWCYHIMGKDLELYDNVDLSRTPKAKNKIRICIGYLEYGLRLPLSQFAAMVLNHFRQSPNQYTIVNFDPFHG